MTETPHTKPTLAASTNCSSEPDTFNQPTPRRSSNNANNCRPCRLADSRELEERTVTCSRVGPVAALGHDQLRRPRHENSTHISILENENDDFWENFQLAADCFDICQKPP
mgnify:CR=1 FL=1